MAEKETSHNQLEPLPSYPLPYNLQKEFSTWRKIIRSDYEPAKWQRSANKQKVVFTKKK